MTHTQENIKQHVMKSPVAGQKNSKRCRRRDSGSGRDLGVQIIEKVEAKVVVAYHRVCSSQI